MFLAPPLYSISYFPTPKSFFNIGISARGGRTTTIFMQKTFLIAVFYCHDMPRHRILSLGVIYPTDACFSDFYEDLHSFRDAFSG